METMNIQKADVSSPLPEERKRTYEEIRSEAEKVFDIEHIKKTNRH